MQNNRQIFLKHDHDRFEQFIKSQTKIAGGTLTPVELVKRSMDRPISLLEIELLEKQWNSLKDLIQIKDKETCFKSALCVCDVSGSMTGTPMEAAIGLTLMTMSFTSEPWCNICFTFSHNPQIVHLQGYRSFFDDVCQLRKADWGCNTDLTKTFKLILQVAKKNDLKQSDMPQSLFIFTDMEFVQGLTDRPSLSFAHINFNSFPFHTQLVIPMKPTTKKRNVYLPNPAINCQL